MKEVATWVGAGVTFLAVVVALLKEEIVRLWRRPDLRIGIRLAAPDCHKTILTFQDSEGPIALSCACYYFRIWVENKGRQRAERVQVFAARLLRRHADGSFRQEASFLPMNLRWAHSFDPTRPEVFAEGISPGMGKHCDLGCIVEPQYKHFVGHLLQGVPPDRVILGLDLEVKPNTGSHLLAPGVYQLELKVAAANAPPVQKRLEFTLTGEWFADERQMFSDGIGIRELD